MHKTHSFRRLGFGVAVAAAALVLAACGGGGGDGGNSSTPPTGSTPTPTVTDAFIAFVQARLVAANDTDEPVPIDSVVATSPEDNEPVPTT